MANIETCILQLRLLGYKARMTDPPGVSAPFPFDLFGPSFVVRCDGFTVSFNETNGIRIESLLPNDAFAILDRSRHLSICYRFENQSFLFSMPDDAFVECVVHHVQEAIAVVGALPDRIRPG